MMPQEAEFNILRSRLALGLPPLHQLILNKQIANIQRREEVHGPPMSFTPLGPLGSGSHAFHCVPLPLCHAPAFRPFFARSSLETPVHSMSSATGVAPSATGGLRRQEKIEQFSLLRKYLTQCPLAAHVSCRKLHQLQLLCIEVWASHPWPGLRAGYSAVFPSSWESHLNHPGQV